jgi:hypothetical protein
MAVIMNINVVWDVTLLKINVVWDVTLCILVQIYQRFGETCWLILQGRNIGKSIPLRIITLQKKAVFSA